MTLGAVQVGDVVLADRKGRRFYAIVTGRGQRELQVEPIDRRVTYHQVKAREVLEIWHKRRRRNGTAATGTEETWSSPNPTPGELDRALLAVCVADDINPTLTGHVGRSYESPPQPREQALTLVQVLLGYTAEQLDGTPHWTCAIAGGRRTVAVKPTIDDWRVTNAAGSLQAMPTLVLGPPPPELKALLERRRRAGLDRLDEVWEGVRHGIPAPSGAHADVAQQLAVLLDRPAREAGLFPTMHEFNLGDGEDDFRVPDGGIHRQRLTGVWHPTAALVVEIVSPGDETWEKLPFYAAHRVDEVLIVDPEKRTVDWLALSDDEYGPVERSGLLKLGPQDLAARIDWPGR